jgi:hypothetical protein
MGRFSVLRRNTSTIDLVKLGLLALVFMVLAVVAVYRQEARVLLIMVVGGFTAPWFFRDLMVENCQKVLNILNIAALCLAGIAIFGNVARQWIPAGSEMAFACGIFAVLALYLGCYFWLLSDERIVRR